MTENLSDRAKAAWGHAHAAMLMLRHFVWVAVAIFVGFSVWSGARAIERTAELRLERQEAQKPHVAEDAPPKDPWWGPPEKLPQRREFAPPARRPGEPPPAPPRADATPANPHPEVTTQSASRAPEANVFEPTSKEQRQEIERTYGVDLSKRFMVTRVKEVPESGSRYGVRFFSSIPAGGGDVETHWVGLERETFEWPRKMAVQLGGVAAWVGGEAPATGFTLHLDLDLLRAGDWHVNVIGDGDRYQSPFLGHRTHYRAAVVGGYVFGDR